MSLPRLLLLLPTLSIASLVYACGGSVDDAEEGEGTGGGGSSSGGSPASGGSAATGGNPSGSGGQVAVDRSCQTGTDCSLLSETCCGTCGAPRLDDMTSVSKGSEAAYRDSVCEEPAICPSCAAFPNPNLYASCEANTCVAQDLTQEPASECTSDSDCRIRAASCCECGAGTGPGELVALNPETASDYLSEVCDPLADCATCAPSYPEEASAVCESGHCRVLDSRSPF